MSGPADPHREYVRSAASATAEGFLAVALWGTSIAASRLIAGSLGILRGPMLSLLVSGGIGAALTLPRRAERERLRRLPVPYWLVCGGLFVLYLLAYNLGVGLARDGAELVAFGVLNYLWPSLTLVFAAAFSRGRVRWWMAPGLALALAGSALALATRADAGLGGMTGVDLRALASHPAPYLLGLCCGVSWGLYSALGRRLAGNLDAHPVPLFFLATAGALALLSLAAPGLASPAARAGSAAGPPDLPGLLAFLWRSLLADLAAYACWDAAMRRGNQLLAAAASFLTPILSSATIAVVLGVDPGWSLWLATALVVCGAVLCQLSVRPATVEAPGARVVPERHDRL